MKPRHQEQKGETVQASLHEGFPINAATPSTAEKHQWQLRGKTRTAVKVLRGCKVVEVHADSFAAYHTPDGCGSGL